jgi:hypothetical protein
MPLYIDSSGILRWLILSIAYCGLASCTSAEGTHTYVGIVRVHVPPTHPGVHSMHAEVLGLALDRGLRIGWSKDSSVEADPAVCQITVLTDRDTDTALLKSELKSLGDHICYATFH